MQNITEPDPEHNYVDEDGVEWQRYVASYEANGEHWSIQFWARDMEDADEHILGMLESMTLDGQVLSAGRLN